jgi:hypothetical protein
MFDQHKNKGKRDKDMRNFTLCDTVDDEADKAFVELCKQNNVELQLVKVEME